jgi:hypothetical protein
MPKAKDIYPNGQVVALRPNEKPSETATTFRLCNVTPNFVAFNLLALVLIQLQI